LTALFTSKSKPSPHRCPVQGAKAVHFGVAAVQGVEKGSAFRPLAEQRNDLLRKLRLGRNHLLVQHAHDQYSIWLNNVENNMLPNLKSAQFCLD
jgi:hypothetical protein